MTKPFYARRYFTIFIVLAFLAPFISRGARRAIETNNNNVKDWLPSTYAESTQLEWFQKHFHAESFAVVSWQGCTLGNQHKLSYLAHKLSDAKAPWSKDEKLFKSVTTGPEMIDYLIDSLGITEAAAIQRLEGALIGPQPKNGDKSDRVTCLVATLASGSTETNRRMRTTIEEISRIAGDDCGIDPKQLHMGGPPVDNVAIDVEGERTLYRLASLAGVVGVALAYWCLRSWLLTIIVFAVGVLSAGLSLAIVYYYGLMEMLLGGLSSPHFGTADAILMSMPAVVYVLGLSGAIHIVNYYRDAVADNSRRGMADVRYGAAEEAMRHGWVPCTLAAFTTAVGLGSLYLSDITPIKKFGLFTAVGVMGTLGILFSWLPACLYRFAPHLPGLDDSGHETPNAGLPPWGRRVAQFIIGRPNLVCGFWLVVMVIGGIGLTKIKTSVQLLKLFDSKADIISDYAWMEANLGNLVPMEVVLRVPGEMQRTVEEKSENGDSNYRMSMPERVELVRMVRDRLEGLKHVGKSLSAAEFAPEVFPGDAGVTGKAREFAIGKQLEKHRDELLKGEYLREEIATQNGDVETNPPAELWRVSARVEALNDVDYGQFVDKLRDVIEPVITAYGWRTRVLGKFHSCNKELFKSKICILANPKGNSRQWDQATVLGRLLEEGEARRVALVNPADVLNDPARLQTVAKYDLVVIATDLSKQDRRLLAGADAPTLDLLAAAKSDDKPAVAVSAVYTGVVPLVYKTQRQLLLSLQESVLAATVLIAMVMMCVLRSFSAGLASMIPNVFPIIVVFGYLGWMGIKVDIGIMMTASVALGVAVDDTIHYLYWYRKGLQETADRKVAAMMAYERCGRAMMQTTIIGGLGLSVFAFSTFTPTQQFGFMMVTMLVAALVGDLLMLPAILVGPIGRFFNVRFTRKRDEGEGAADETPQRLEKTLSPLRRRHDAPHRSIRA